ncbi:ABC transporter ATP-binding protein [Hamadaea sp.]|uniref:ABC transporter ATP-binding protein n=1 Tax=Hamadaea sp. TaxID=2024425 RepID=UPI0025BBA928|nr:ABC transporter ATP-binding protein [Hamadaea sp.]
MDHEPVKGLDAQLIVRRAGGFRLDVRLTVAPGEVVALLGPNGAGKSTALRALAGLLPLSDGHVILDGRVLDRPADRVLVPPDRRPVGVVFQDYLLFPHLTALDNVAFGPRHHGRGTADARSIAAGWLDRVGLAAYARSKPRRLSGGQAQRVALARALAVEPALLLLDEPLSALDARTRLDTRAQLHRHLGEHPGATLLVTHDPLDALVLADRLIIVEDGVVVQEGDAATITAQPRTDYVAQLVGLNLYRGQADGHVITVPGGFTLTAADTVRGDAFVAFPPSALALYPNRPDGSPSNTWPATITGVQQHGDYLRVQLSGPIEAAADITPAAAIRLQLSPGQPVWAALKATETRAYPA